VQFITPSSITSKTHWILSKMPRPIKNLLPYRDAITEWACTNVTREEIAKRLKDLWGIEVNSRTVERRLQQWGIQTRTQTADTPFLRAQIAIMYRLGDTDEEMLEDLQDLGYNASITGVTRIRRDLGLARRMTVTDRQAEDEQLFEILKNELDDGRIAGYGRRHLHVYFKQQGQLVTR
jgi:arginine repressor